MEEDHVTDKKSSYLHFCLAWVPCVCVSPDCDRLIDCGSGGAAAHTQSSSECVASALQQVWSICRMNTKASKGLTCKAQHVAQAVLSEEVHPVFGPWVWLDGPANGVGHREAEVPGSSLLILRREYGKEKNCSWHCLV